MSSKQVTDREKSASSVVAVGDTQAQSIGEALAKRLKPSLHKGETMPDLALVTLVGTWSWAGPSTERSTLVGPTSDTGYQGDTEPVSGTGPVPVPDTERVFAAPRLATGSFSRRKDASAGDG